MEESYFLSTKYLILFSFLQITITNYFVIWTACGELHLCMKNGSGKGAKTVDTAIGFFCLFN